MSDKPDYTALTNGFCESNNIAMEEVKYKLGDFDIWYMPCEKCGYDTARSVKPKNSTKTCWKCGSYVRRDYSERALKINRRN